MSFPLYAGKSCRERYLADGHARPMVGHDDAKTLPVGDENAGCGNVGTGLLPATAA